MSNLFRGTCLGILAVGLAVGGMYGLRAADDPKPGEKSGDTKAPPAGEKPKVEKPAAAKPAKPDQAELERRFAEKLSNCALVGRFTVDGGEGKPSEDTYVITKASKLKDDVWMFSGIKYGGSDIKIPLAIRVVWAGDTPMMAMDKFTIPGLGTFSFRLMFDGDRYAGTWQHDDHGGHMWGRIERAKTDAKDAPKGAAAKKEGQAKIEPKKSVEDRLQKEISVYFRDTPLYQSVEQIAKKTGVTITIEDQELKMSGVTQNMKGNLKETGTGVALLTTIFSKIGQLVVVADDAQDRAIVTSAAAAKARGLTPLTPKKKSEQ